MLKVSTLVGLISVAGVAQATDVLGSKSLAGVQGNDGFRVVDWNGDGRKDLVTRNSSDGKIRLWLQAKDKSMIEEPVNVIDSLGNQTSTVVTSAGFQVADWDADGDMDIVTRNSADNFNVWLQTDREAQAKKPVAQYSFDDASTLGKDSSSNGFNGVLSNVTSVQGKIGGGAASFNNSFINIGAHSAIQDSQNFTISGWFNTNDVNNYSTLYNETGRDPAVYDGRDIRFYNGRLNVNIYNQGVYNSVSSNPISTGQWYHFAFVKDQDTVKVYINGALHGSNTKANAYLPSGDEGNLGRYKVGTDIGGAYTGLLDEFRFYNYALTPGDVMTLSEQQ